MLLNQVLGHQKQLAQLRSDLENRNLAHGYLLAGPAGVGKFTVAKAFARELQTRDLELSEAESILKLIDCGNHLDTMIVAKESEKEALGIEQLRKIIVNLHMSGESRYRILLIKDIERMTVEATNAMLKILEEPPGKVLFILTTSKPQSILETIISRLRCVDFGVFSDEEMKKNLMLKHRLIDQELLSQVVELSGGKIAQAIRLLENEQLLESYRDIYNQIEDFISKRNKTEAFQFISQIHDDKLLVQIFIEICFVLLRKKLKQSMVDKKADLTIIANAQMDALFKLKQMSETNVNSRLLMENFVLSL